MLKRKITEKLIKWKKNNNKKALLVKGARQVGKSTSIKEFAKNHYKNVVVVDFVEQPEATIAFKGKLDADTVIRTLSVIGYGPFVEGETLVFFDEIQMCPNARTAIKYLVQDGRYDYIESGSLLGINYKEIRSFPVGFERTIEMFPLDFEEFLWARNIGENILEDIRRCYDNLIPVDKFEHNQMMKYFREYMYMGGMPSVVNVSLEKPDFAAVIGEQHALMENYRNDISLYAGGEKTLAMNMFDKIPSQLAKISKRFILDDTEEGTTFDKYKDAAQWIVDAGVTYQCFQLTGLDLPLPVHEKRDFYKLYLLDTGLLCSEITEGIQRAILFDNLAVNEGCIVENAVAAALRQSGKPLYYYDKKSRVEFDFCFMDNNKVSIIEVKSGKEYNTHASLDKAVEMFGDKLNRRIVLSKNNVEVGSNGVIYLPLYMTMFL
ncbi:MAG: AAA family ATPase [Oscillospiraceae bacterium]|jgi:predicted AAA+ superfamily ATPase|nr:AAA family ATPase [Oscillospiraceae bacterium]